MKPQGDGRVRCSAWLGRTVNGIKSFFVSDIITVQVIDVRRMEADEVLAPMRLEAHELVFVSECKTPRDRLARPLVLSADMKSARLWRPEKARRQSAIRSLGAFLGVCCPYDGGDVRPNDPSSATRPTRAFDCNLDAMAGFAAAHG